MEIPKQLQKEGINFVLLEKEGKKPFQRDWQKKTIEFDSQELISHNGNYGVRGGGDLKLVIVDFDNEQVQEEVIKKLPKTFTVKTGSGLLHKYFIPFHATPTPFNTFKPAFLTSLPQFIHLTV